MNGLNVDPAAAPAGRRGHRGHRGRIGRIGRGAAAAAAVVALLLATAGCTVNQQLTLRVDRSGAAHIEVELEQVFVDYLDTLSEAAGSSSSTNGLGFSILSAYWNPAMSVLRVAR